MEILVSAPGVGVNFLNFEMRVSFSASRRSREFRQILPRPEVSLLDSEERIKKILHHFFPFFFLFLSSFFNPEETRRRGEWRRNSFPPSRYRNAPGKKEGLPCENEIPKINIVSYFKSLSSWRRKVKIRFIRLSSW